MPRKSSQCPACGASVPPTGLCPFCGNTVLLEGVAGRLLPSTLHCPRCPDRPALRGLSHEGIRTDLCLACHGSWFGPGMLLEALRTASKRPPAAGEGETGPAHGGVEPVRYTTCPACDGGMTRAPLARKPLVIIDRCPAHGDWCDGGEFAQLTIVARSRGMEAIGPPAEEKSPAIRPRLSEMSDPLGGVKLEPGDLFTPETLAEESTRGRGWSIGIGRRRRRGPDLFDLIWALFRS